MTFRALVLSATLLAAGSVLSADKPGPNDWPQWRGPNRDGKSTEVGLLASWPKNGPPKAWTAKDLGLGYGTPSVANGKIYGIGSREGKDGVWAVKESDGSNLWFTPFSPTADVAKNTNGPASTPTYHDGKLYTVSLGGSLACMNADNGKVIWQKEYTGAEFGGKRPTWGYSESVLVDDGKVIAIPGGSKAAVVALKPDTGDVIWKTEVSKVGGGTGYSSAVKTTIGGTPMYVALLGTDGGVIGVHAETGKLLWQYNKAALGGVAQIPTPIVKDDKVWFSTSYGGGSALLQIVPADGMFTVKQLNAYKKPELNNHHGGMILLGDYIYFGHDQNNGIPVCVDIRTGKIVWKADKVLPGGGGSAAYLYADGHLYIRYTNRYLALVTPSPKEEEFKVVSGFMLPEADVAKYAQSWPHPVIANGKLFIRDQNVMYCYNIKASMN